MKKSEAKTLLKKLIRTVLHQQIHENAMAKDLATLLKMARAAGKGQTQRPLNIKQLPQTEPDMGAGAAVMSMTGGMAGGNKSFPQTQQHARTTNSAIQMFTDGRDLWYMTGGWYIRAADIGPPDNGGNNLAQ